jgi:hypothetical protein
LRNAVGANFEFHVDKFFSGNRGGKFDRHSSFLTRFSQRKNFRTHFENIWPESCQVQLETRNQAWT